ncbi:MAG TPA: D-glycerate dehydrogenase [Ilumatobacter sp.]|nr:D-glycerate dehydrogenase [Ilumatobacter sp.]
MLCDSATDTASDDDGAMRHLDRSNVVVLGRIPAAGLDELREHHDVWVWDRDGSPPTDVRNDALVNADAAITLLNDRVDDDFLSAAPRLRVVSNVAVGYDNIDVSACEARSVIVTNTPGVLTDATADLAFGLLLAVTRRLGEGERLIRSGEPWKWSMFMMLGTSLQHRQIGIVGMGDIGLAMARRARAFGMTVAYHNRRPVQPDVAAELDATLMGLDELLATSDVVSLHCPYSPETHHLIDAPAFARMRDGAFLINTARGPIVHEAALVDALDRGSLAGAGLDVYEHEPEVHPGLLTHDNVVLAPHLGSATVETRTAMAVLAARNVIEVLAGRPPLTPVSTSPVQLRVDVADPTPYDGGHDVYG